MSEWISVDDRMPEDRAEILIYFETACLSNVAIGYYQDTYWFEIHGDKRVVTDNWPTHWMELPGPPK